MESQSTNESSSPSCSHDLSRQVVKKSKALKSPLRVERMTNLLHHHMYSLEFRVASQLSKQRSGKLFRIKILLEKIVQFVRAFIRLAVFSENVKCFNCRTSRRVLLENRVSATFMLFYFFGTILPLLIEGPPASNHQPPVFIHER